MSELQTVYKWSKLGKKSNLTLIHELISEELQQLGHPNFLWYFTLNLPTFSQSLVSELQMVQKYSKFEKKLNITLIYWLISHELKQLGHPKFAWYFRLNLRTFSQSFHSLASFVLELLSFIVCVYIYKFYNYMLFYGLW